METMNHILEIFSEPLFMYSKLLGKVTFVVPVGALEFFHTLLKKVSDQPAFVALS